MTLRAVLQRVAQGRSGVIFVTAIVAGVYVIWASSVAFDEAPIRLASPSERLLEQGAGASAAIDALRPHAVEHSGHDGQFALFIALAPFDADAYLDNPAYRLGRPLYPVLSWASAGGNATAVPYALVLVNILAAITLTLALALVLARFDASPWYALVAGLAPGLAIAVGRDLVEPVAYALTALASLMLVGGAGRWRIVPGAVLFALAALARETTLLFPLAAALALVLGAVPEAEARTPRRDRVVRAAALLLIACAPLLLLKAMLAAGLPGDSLPSSARSEPFPFWGIVGDGLRGGDYYQLLYLVLPALVGLGIVAVTVRRPAAPVLALGLNVLFLVALLPRASYEHYLTSSRIMLGVVVAFVLCIPLVPEERRALVSVPIFLWVAAWVDVYWTFVGI